MCTLPISLIVIESTAPFGWVKKEYVLCSSSSFQDVNVSQLGNTLICISKMLLVVQYSYSYVRT